MDLYEFSASNPLKARKRRIESDEGSTKFMDEVFEQDFESKLGYEGRKRGKLLASYYSDSSNNDDYDSDEPSGQSGQENEKLEKVSSGETNRAPNGNNNYDIFAEDENGLISNNENPVEKSHRSQLGVMDIAKFTQDNLSGLVAGKNDGSYNENDESIKIDAFNIDEESKNGIFDKQGNYIEVEGDPEDAIQQQDLWIDDFKNVKKAAESKEKLKNKTLQASSKSNRRRYMLEDALIRLEFFLYKTEAVVDTLGRLSKLRKNEKLIKDDFDVLYNKYLVHGINFLSDLITVLETKDIGNVYDLTRADVQKLIEEESLTNDRYDDYKSKLWNFKWIDKMKEVHGPYTNYQMQYWKQTYFNHRVVVKFHEEEDEESNWLHIDSISFM